MSSLPKLITVIVIALIVIRQWQLGYFKSLKFQPYRFDQPKALLFLIGVLAFVLPLLFWFDPILIKYLGQPQEEPIPTIAHYGGLLGRNAHPWLCVAVFYSAGMLLKNQKLSDASFLALLSGLAAGLGSAFFKFVFLRARPYQQLGHLSFFNLDGLLKDDKGFQSFSSGDVAVVTGILYCISTGVRNPFLKWTLRVLPLANCVSRIYPFKHWPSDTVLGMAIGIFMVYFILPLFQKRTLL